MPRAPSAFPFLGRLRRWAINPTSPKRVNVRFKYWWRRVCRLSMRILVWTNDKNVFCVDGKKTEFLPDSDFQTNIYCKQWVYNSHRNIKKNLKKRKEEKKESKIKLSEAVFSADWQTLYHCGKRQIDIVQAKSNQFVTSFSVEFCPF